ncbi:hypothetical protein BgiBS90_001333 [Biomphalaria glabrata]|nr:hypothetical protein BgiBS90_001333 [Biomphalaria glabrata]
MRQYKKRTSFFLFNLNSHIIQSEKISSERLDDDNDGMDAGKCKALDIVSVMAWAGRDKLLENRALSSPQVAAHFLLSALSSL